MIRSGGCSLASLQRLVAARRDFDDGVAAALERVLDEPGDVVFVFDDEHAGLVGRRACAAAHGRRRELARIGCLLGPIARFTVAAADFRPGDDGVNSGLPSRVSGAEIGGYATRYAGAIAAVAQFS